MRGLAHIAAILAGSLTVAPAFGQVIEIDAEGGATVYDRPTLFVGDSVAPISLSPAGPARARQGNGAFEEAARAHGLSPDLLAAVAWQESRGRPNAISPKGAIGVMQLMPATARQLGVDPFDPADNIRGGATYLRQQIDRFGSVPLGLAAYNAGPGSVLRHGGIPPYRETQSYVSSILARLASTGKPEAGAIPVRTPLLIEVATP